MGRLAEEKCGAQAGFGGREEGERVEDKLAADKASEKRGVRPRNTADDCEHPIRHVVYVSA